MDEFQNWLGEVLVCDPAFLPPNSTPLRDIDGWDSLKHVLLIVGLENKLNTKLTADEIQSMVTIADVAAVFREKSVHV